MSASSKKQLRKEQNLAALTEKQLQEKKEAKKLKIYTISFILVIALIVGIGVGMLVRNVVVNSGMMQKTTAVKIGDHKLSAAELNYFYVDNIQEYYNYCKESYGDSVDMYLAWLQGLTPSLPLDQQYYDTEKTVTWAEHFANQSVSDAAAIYALYDEAIAKGHTLTEEELANIDSNIEFYEMYAPMLGYKSFEDYLHQVYGAGSSVKTYRKHLEVNALAENYYNAYADSLSYTDADFRAHEADCYEEFNSYSYSYFYVNAEKFLNGGTTAEDGKITYSDEEIAASVEAAKAAAQSLVDSGAADAAALKESIKQIPQLASFEEEEFFTQKDVLFANISGLSNVTADKIKEWVTDDARAAGDLTVFANERTTTAEDGTSTTTTSGYFVMMFEGVNENKMNLVNVRHILLAFEGGTTDQTTGETTYTEEEKKAALDKANAVLDTYNAGEKTEDSFTALVADNSKDTGSVNNGGLYEDVYPGQMVEAFNDWCFDEARQTGDVEIVETEYGYHIMYYVGTSETIFRDFMIENTLRNNDVNEWYNALVATVKPENVKIKYLNLDYIMNPNSQY